MWYFFCIRAANKDAETAMLKSQKAASDRDIEKYRHEADIYTRPILTGVELAEQFKRLRDRNGQ